ncbi:hypothetical protein GCM10017786_00260 [Amycolatopsis deserti]|uniref:Uncharacterized protein n=1 Tax=Amycolatopsis deserti TaxID=185696 RepID=A0ABQ3I9J6_9PSEU|nr:hypothetical protein GCM10017786_00260 [Amycolatopsis deserti]
MHRVPRLAQAVGDAAHALGQALDVVVQHDLGHVGHPSVDPIAWNIGDASLSGHLASEKIHIRPIRSGDGPECPA